MHIYSNGGMLLLCYQIDGTRKLQTL